MGEQHNHEAFTARCVPRTHGKHYSASGMLINGEMVQIRCFYSCIFPMCVTALDLWFQFRAKTLQMGTGAVDSSSSSLPSLSVCLVSRVKPLRLACQIV